MTTRHLIVCTYVIAQIWLTAGASEANVAAPWDSPAVIGRVTGPTLRGLLVARESLKIRCTRQLGAPSCNFEAHYTFRNVSYAPITVTPAFMSWRASGIVVTRDGKTVNTTLSSAARQRYSDNAMRIERQKSKSTVKVALGPLALQGFKLEIAERSDAEFVVRGTMTPEGQSSHTAAYARSALDTRHMLLAQRRLSSQYVVSYYVAPIRTWGPAPTIDLQVETPIAWNTQLRLDERDATVKRTVSNGVLVQRARVSAGNVQNLHLQFSIETKGRLGGLFAAAGGEVINGGFRFRAGASAAFTEWFLLEAAADTNFKDALTVAVLAKAALPAWLLFAPSASVGIGLPLQLEPDVAAGIRAQVELHWPFVGFVANLDIYPAHFSGDPPPVQLMLYGQVGL